MNEIYLNFNKTALFYAVQKKDIEMVKVLLSCQRIDVNIQCAFNTIIFYAVFN